MNESASGARSILTRRALVAGGAGLLSAREIGAAAAAASRGDDLRLTSGEGNAQLMARILGNTRSGQTKHGWYRGRVMAIAPGGAGRDLLGIMGMSSQRLIPLDGKPGWSLLQREVGFFFDLTNGRVVDRWLNPLSGEPNDVMHIANPSVSRDIEPVEHDARFYDDPVKGSGASRDISEKGMQVTAAFAMPAQIPSRSCG